MGYWLTPSHRDSSGEHWCFLCYEFEQVVEQAVDMQVICDVLAHVMLL